MIDHFASWIDLPWAVIDFETTGWHVDGNDRVLEIAVVRMHHGQVIDLYSSLINPQRPIPWEASNVHGIYGQHVATAPRFIDVLPRFAALTNGAVPVAYQEQFDRRFMRAELRRSGFHDGLGTPALDLGWPRWVDPLTWVRSIDRFVENGKASHKLGVACQRWGIGLDQGHRAQADATATGKLLWAMAADIGRMTTSELLRRQEALATTRKERRDVGPSRQDPSPSGSDEGA